MNRQILHGCIRGVYQTILNDLPEEYLGLIPTSTERLLAYGADADPCHHTLMPLHTSSGTVLLYAACMRKQNAAEDAYYVHKQIIRCGTKKLLDAFDEILKTPFYTEDAFDRMADGAQDFQPRGRWYGTAVQIHPEVLRAVLYGIVGRWRAGTSPVVIAVPDHVDYDSYCFGAISQIYSYLPAGLRAMAGFMTYTAPVDSLNDVAVFFVPARVAKNAVHLDRENERSEELLKVYLPESLRRMIDRVVDYEDPAQREQYLNWIRRYVESDDTDDDQLMPLKAKQYTDFLDNCQLLDMTLDSKEKFDKLAAFFSDPGSTPEKVQQSLRDTLDERVTEQMLDEYVLAAEETDTTFERYVDRIAVIAPMVSCSEKLMKHVKTRMQECFRSELEHASDLETLDAVMGQLDRLAGNPGPLLDEQTLTDFREWVQEKRQEPLRKAAKERVAQAEQARTQLADLDLEDLDKAIGDIDNQLTEDLAGLEIDTAQELADYRAGTKTFRTERIKQQIKQLCDSKLTSDIYKKTKKRLEAMRDYLRRRDDPLLDAVIKAIDVLRGDYSKTDSALDDELMNAWSQGTYFQALERVMAIAAKNTVPPEKLKKTLENLEGRRPSSFAAYKADFREHYKNRELSVAELLRNGPRVGNQQLSDWQHFLRQDLTIRVDNKSLTEILRTIIRVSAEYAVLHEPVQEIRLSCAGADVPYPKQRLENTIWAFTGADVNPEQLIQDEYSLIRLLDQLQYARYSDADRIVFLQTLVRMNCGQSVIDKFWNCMVLPRAGEHENFRAKAARVLENSQYGPVTTEEKHFRQGGKNQSGRKGRTGKKNNRGAAGGTEDGYTVPEKKPDGILTLLLMMLGIIALLMAVFLFSSGSNRTPRPNGTQPPAVVATSASETAESAETTEPSASSDPADADDPTDPTEASDPEAASDPSGPEETEEVPVIPLS